MILTFGYIVMAFPNMWQTDEYRIFAYDLKTQTLSSSAKPNIYGHDSDNGCWRRKIWLLTSKNDIMLIIRILSNSAVEVPVYESAQKQNT